MRLTDPKDDPIQARRECIAVLLAQRVDRAEIQRECKISARTLLVELNIITGRCAWCGASKRHGNKIICRKCSRKATARISTLRRERSAKGLCRCGKKPPEGFRLCDECRPKYAK